jgi:hypothetical protein
MVLADGNRWHTKCLEGQRLARDNPDQGERILVIAWAERRCGAHGIGNPAAPAW